MELYDRSRGKDVKGDETDESTQVEKEHKKVHGDGLLDREDATLFRAGLPVSLILATAVALGLITTGAWAIIQCMVFFSITTQVSISVIIISVLVIIVGVLMIVGIVGCVFCVKYERTSPDSWFAVALLTMPIVFMFIFVVILIALGIAAGALIPSLPESIGTSANMSLFNISDPQGASDAWDVAQNTFRCCGAVYFSDYEQVFNDYSVPVSCCNTTNPLVNETTCPDIVSDTNVANATELIYTEGCVPQLVSYYHYILSVIAGVSIIIGAVPVIGTLYTLSALVTIFGFNVKTSDNRNFKKFYKYFPTVIGLILILGLGFIVVAIWALVQNLSFYNSITASASDVSLLSVLLIITGGLMIGTGGCQIGTSRCYMRRKGFIILCCGEFWFVCLCVLPMVILALIVGILAAGMSGPTIMELNTTLHKYLDDQTVQDTWNDLQRNMECCGVSNFTDYELVFSNFSVPVSCCNTTNPLASECPDIVRNSQQMINQTDLIYSEGCASHLKSFFDQVFGVIAAVASTIAGLQLAAVFISLWCFSLVVLRIADSDVKLK